MQLTLFYQPKLKNCKRLDTLGNIFIYIIERLEKCIYVVQLCRRKNFTDKFQRGNLNLYSKLHAAYKFS